MSFKLDLTGRYIIEDDGSPHPTLWTVTEANSRRVRLENQAAQYEREADLFDQQGRTIDAGVSRALASHDMGRALELFRVLQSVEREVA